MKNYVKNSFYFLVLLSSVFLFNSCQGDSVQDGSLETSSSESELEIVDYEGFLDEFDEIDSTKLYSIQGENGMYLSSENGTMAMTCTRSEIGPWEEFELVVTGTEEIAIMDNNGEYLTYDEESDSFTFNASTIEEAQSFAVVEYTYGQSELFYGNWYNRIYPVGEPYNVWAIDTSNDNTIRTGIVGAEYEYGEFRIESIE